ncbi:MAG: polysaccharide deacetylase family protein [Clostridia bacterium]|nr:polysaccharide deacetylase family protein [Clostridia bacterium]
MLIIFRKKQVFAVCLCLAVLIGVSGMLFGGNSIVSTVSKTDWGLGYYENGVPPTGNKSQAELTPLNAFYLGDTTQKKIYITFDAGYENGYTAKILDILKKHKAPAAFFLVGNYIEKEPDLVKRMIAEGHTVGNHTMSHPDMSKISDEESFKEELSKLEQMYESVTGTPMKKLYRPPQGKFSMENLKMANSMGYKTFFWSLAYVDWIEGNQPTKDQAFSKLIPRIHNGAIVLLHSTSKTNAEILDELLTKWSEMGYSFGDISEL